MMRTVILMIMDQSGDQTTRLLKSVELEAAVDPLRLGKWMAYHPDYPSVFGWGNTTEIAIVDWLKNLLTSEQGGADAPIWSHEGDYDVTSSDQLEW